MIIERFEEICGRLNDKQLTAPMELDLENFINILRSDGLNLLNEDLLIELVRSYINIRDKIEPKKANSAEAQTPPALWALLTEAERENRKATFEAEAEVRNATEAETMDKDAAIYFAKEQTGKV